MVIKPIKIQTINFHPFSFGNVAAIFKSLKCCLRVVLIAKEYLNINTHLIHNDAILPVKDRYALCVCACINTHT